MKRFFTWLLALCLLSCAFVFPARAEEEKQIFIELSQTGDLYRADLVWTGVAKEDDIGGIQFSFSYDQSFFTVEKYALGASLKDFSIKMGPENKASYPLIFLGASGSAAVETEGTLASVWLKAKDGAAGSTALEIKDLALVRFSDNGKITDLYTVQNLDLSLASAGADQAPELFYVSGQGELIAPPAADPDASSDDTPADPIAPVTDDPILQTEVPGKSGEEGQAPSGESGTETVGAAKEKTDEPKEQFDQLFTITLIVAISCILLAVAVAVLFAVVQRRRKKEANLAENEKETSAPDASSEEKDNADPKNGDPE